MTDGAARASRYAPAMLNRCSNLLRNPSRARLTSLLGGVLLVSAMGCKEEEPSFPGIDPAAAKEARKKAAVQTAKSPKAVVVPDAPPGATAPVPGKSLKPKAPLLAPEKVPLPGPLDVVKLEGPGAGFSDPVKSGDYQLYTAMDRALSSVYPGTQTGDKAMRIKRSADGVVVLATVISADSKPYAYDIRILFASLKAMKATDEVLANVAGDVGEALKLVPKEVGLELSAKVGQLVEGKEVQPRTYAAPEPFVLVTEARREGEDRGFISVTLRLADANDENKVAAP